MPDVVGSVSRRAAPLALLILALAGLAGSAAAQEPLTHPPLRAEFLSRYDFLVLLAGLDSNDNRFSWDARAEADLDVVDYVVGRASVRAGYEAIMGNEQQLFDPNQSLYTLEASSSLRAGPTEFAAVLHHVSRHLSDRANTRGIGMNLAGGRVLRRIRVAGASLDLRADGGWVIMRSYLDYTWRAQIDLVARRPLTARLGLLGRAFGETYGVDPTIAGRARQHGGRLEGGVRISGQAATMELFAGYERVVDADPLGPAAWPLGIRRFSHRQLIPFSYDAKDRSLPRVRAGPGGRRPVVQPCTVGRRAAPEAAVPDIDAAERADGDLLGGSLDADRPPAALVSRRVEERDGRGAPASRISSST